MSASIVDLVFLARGLSSREKLVLTCTAVRMHTQGTGISSTQELADECGILPDEAALTARSLVETGLLKEGSFPRLARRVLVIDTKKLVKNCLEHHRDDPETLSWIDDLARSLNV